MQGDLTTLARVKEWLSGQAPLSSDNDSLLSRLISASSKFALNHIAREIAVRDYDEWYDSGGRNFISLRQFPVRTVESIQFAGFEVTEPATGNPPASGWLLSPPTRLEVRGWCFPRGRSVVRVQYSAGYSAEDEAHTVPTTPDPLVIATSKAWLDDLGVTVGGVALTAVTGTPGAGQYSVSSDGAYTFNAAQSGLVALISYSCVPPDLEQAVVELVGERFKQRDRIGLNSKNLPNGETISFLQKDMSDNVRTCLERYQNQGAW